MNSNNIDNEMSIAEHLGELRSRLLTVLIIFVTATIFSFTTLRNITLFLQEPATGVKFLQLAPGEYFFVSMKIAIYAALLLSFPFAIYQIIKFILPGLTENEATFVVPSLIGSIILFFIGVTFGYYVLAPAALAFFIQYGSDIIEPIWSFEQYFDFILLLLFSTGLAFQIPILQIFLGLLNIVTSKQMLSAWKYVVVLSTIIGAILTPSTDPFTQLIMSSAILTLYFTGVMILVVLKK